MQMLILRGQFLREPVCSSPGFILVFVNGNEQDLRQVKFL